MVQSSLKSNSSKLLRLVLVTSNFDDDSIKNKQARMDTAFSHHKSTGKSFRRARAPNSLVNGPIWPKFNSSKILFILLVTCKYRKDHIKNKTRNGGDIVFPIISQWGLFVAMETSFNPICPKTLCSLSPTPVMLHIKSDQDWPTDFKDIQVWKCGRWRRRTDDGPLVYYKLTLWAFGSGELKMYR